MAAADPYRDWLKIQQPRRPLTHYELLRLPALEPDPRAIRAAADRQVQRLSRVESDAQRQAVWRLLREVAAARDCLLDSRQKAAYDAALKTADARLASKKPARTTDTPAVGESLADDRPAVPLLPPRLSAATDEADQDPGEGEPPAAAVAKPESVAVATGISTHRRRVIAARKKRRSNWVWQAGTVAVLAAALAVIGVIWWVTDGHRRLLAVTSGSGDHVARPPVVGAAPPTHERTVEHHDTGPVAASNNDIRQPATPAGVIEDPDSAIDRPAPMATEDSDAPPEPQDVAAVREALNKSRRALAQRDLPAADVALDRAAELAQHPELAAGVSQSRTLLHYVRGFWNAVEQSIASLKGGEELVWRDQRTIVVEGGAGRFILRVAGVNRTFQTEQLPADLAVLLAERWLAADDPNSPMFTAAFLSVDPDGDAQRARSIFRTARAHGIEAADDLLAIMDGTAKR